MENRDKFVHFHEYCEKCKHKDKAENEDPCWDCLEYPTNIDSHKPIYFEEKGEKYERNSGSND